MSVYKEGFHALKDISEQGMQIYEDACDFGVPVKQNDKLWNTVKQLVEWYGDPETREEYRYRRGKSVECQITLYDEWSVSDGRKTHEEAEQKYTVRFTSCKEGACLNKDGYISIYEISK